jgi:hypothetical protein
MGKIKLGRALCLSILGVLSMMALFAVSAQANLFLLEKKAAAAGDTFGGIQLGVGKLLILNLGIEINCAKGEVEEGKLLSDTIALAKLLYKECTVLNDPAGTESVCKANSKGAAEKEILAITKALPKVAGGEQWVLFESDEKEDFVTIELKGEACAAKGTYPVTGTTVALVDNNETKEPELLLSPTITAAYKTASGETDELKFGIRIAHITGTFKVFWTGKDEGKLFGIC